jgi:hypothetical protein
MLLDQVEDSDFVIPSTQLFPLHLTQIDDQIMCPCYGFVVDCMAICGLSLF